MERGTHNLPFTMGLTLKEEYILARLKMYLYSKGYNLKNESAESILKNNRETQPYKNFSEEFDIMKKNKVDINPLINEISNFNLRFKDHYLNKPAFDVILESLNDIHSTIASLSESTIKDELIINNFKENIRNSNYIYPLISKNDLLMKLREQMRNIIRKLGERKAERKPYFKDLKESDKKVEEQLNNSFDSYKTLYKQVLEELFDLDSNNSRDIGRAIYEINYLNEIRHIASATVSVTENEKRLEEDDFLPLNADDSNINDERKKARITYLNKFRIRDNFNNDILKLYINYNKNKIKLEAANLNAVFTNNILEKKIGQTMSEDQISILKNNIEELVKENINAIPKQQGVHNTSNGDNGFKYQDPKNRIPIRKMPRGQRIFGQIRNLEG